MNWKNATNRDEIGCACRHPKVLIDTPQVTIGTPRVPIGT